VQPWYEENKYIIYPYIFRGLTHGSARITSGRKDKKKIFPLWVCRINNFGELTLQGTVDRGKLCAPSAPYTDPVRGGRTLSFCLRYSSRHRLRWQPTWDSYNP
jgi:hypothetical protein